MSERKRTDSAVGSSNHHHSSRAPRGRRHHSHHSGIKHRIKRWYRKHRWVPLALAIMLVLIVGAGFWMLSNKRSQDGMHVVMGNQVDVGSGYRDIEYKGKHYRYNNRITSILYAGVDSDSPLVKLGSYTAAPRADSISLVVMDELHQRITIIALSRDTITDIRKYTLDGYSRGFYKDHLGYAYTYGDGEKASCRNLCEAVSKLLFDIPISGYVISNRASLPLLGDAIGPVEVTVPNDDLAEYGLFEGETTVIDAQNLEAFVRSRDTAEDLSNVGRMARQQAYIEGAIGKIMDLLEADASHVWSIVEQAEDSVVTNITRSRYLDLTRVLKKTAYSPGSYYIPEGEQVVGERYDEFYPDPEALQQEVIDLFYIER